MSELLKKYNYFVDYPNHPRCEDRSRFVYLFFNPITTLTKIGITNSPKARISQIRNSGGMNVFALLILELLPDYDESPEFIEKFLHQFYDKKRSFGEWFSLNIRDLVSIRDLFYEIYGEDIQDNLSDKNFRKKMSEYLNRTRQ